MATTAKPLNLLVDCLICGLDRTDRNPRELPCKHAFCEKCLMETTGIHIKGKLQCPVCMEETDVLQNGVSALPLDTKAKKAKAAFDVVKEYHNCALCIVKGERKQAVSWCRDCDFRLCKVCVETHTNKQIFSFHVVAETVCIIHIRELTRACLTCRTGICYECIVSELHDDHETCDLTEVKEKAQSIIEEGKSVIEKEILDLDKLINEKMDRSLKLIRDRRRETEEKLENYIKIILETITSGMDKREEDFHREVNKALEKQNSACSLASNSLNELNVMLEGGKIEVLEQFMLATSNIFRTVNSVRAAKCIQTTSPEIDKDEYTTTGGIDTGRFQFIFSLGGIVGDTFTYEKKPEKKFELKTLNAKPGGISSLCYIVALHDGSAILGMSNRNAAIKVNSTGQVIEMYPFEKSSSSIGGLDIYDDKIYTLSKYQRQVRMFTSSTNYDILLQTGPENLWSMIVDDGKILAGRINGEILRYSPDGLLLDSLPASPGEHIIKMAVHPVAGKVYLVSCKEKLKVYSTYWKLIRTIGDREGDGQMGVVLGSTMLPNGNILIADYKQTRVSEFTFDGKYVRHLLTQEDGLKDVYNISFKHPYLWVACLKAALLFIYA